MIRKPHGDGQSGFELLTNFSHPSPFAESGTNLAHVDLSKCLWLLAGSSEPLPPDHSYGSPHILCGHFDCSDRRIRLGMRRAWLFKVDRAENDAYWVRGNQ